MHSPPRVERGAMTNILDLIDSGPGRGHRGWLRVISSGRPIGVKIDDVVASLGSTEHMRHAVGLVQCVLRQSEQCLWVMTHGPRARPISGSRRAHNTQSNERVHSHVVARSARSKCCHLVVSPKCCGFLNCQNIGAHSSEKCFYCLKCLNSLGAGVSPKNKKLYELWKITALFETVCSNLWEI